MAGQIAETIAKLVWGPGTVLLILACGLYFTCSLRCFQVRRCGAMLRLPFEKREKTGGISAFAAMTTALAGTMGVGNVVGVGAAIAIGGPGAVFWMWVSAFFGMATKYAEIVLAMHYREKDADGNPLGGPMVYIRRGLGSPFLANLFCLLTVLASFGIGNAIQIGAMTESLQKNFGVPVLVCGIVTVLLASRIIFGGAKVISRTTALLTPVLSVVYILGCLVILVINAGALPGALGQIFRYAFAPAPAVGGFVGVSVTACIRCGVSHGVFSNEAGMGSSSIAHASSEADDPVRQGLWGIFEVFFDTIVVCTLTALAILTSGVWTQDISGASLTAVAFERAFPAFGGKFIAVSVFLFAFATLLSWSFYGQKCVLYLFGKKGVPVYKTVFVAVAFLATFVGFDFLLVLCDIFNGLMVIPNVFALLLLRRQVRDITLGIDEGRRILYNHPIKST